MAKLLAMIVGLLASPTFAQDFHQLEGKGVHQALTARVLQYAPNIQQDFFADGRTLYQSPEESWGTWRVKGDKYCSKWPPADGWACYDVYASDTGLDIRFVDAQGRITVGRYIDLN